jgi:hypothetical protein
MSLRHLSTFRGIATEIRLLSSSAGDPPKKSGLRSETRRHVGSRATECPAWFFRFQRAARFGAIVRTQSLGRFVHEEQRRVEQQGMRDYTYCSPPDRGPAH